MSIPRRLWNMLRSEVNHRLGNFDTAEHKAFREAWEEANRETEFDFDDDFAGVAGESSGAAEHYRTLGLTVDADFSDVRLAYKRLVKEHHPDNFQNEDEVRAATLRFQKINAAYTALKNAQ